MKNRISIIGLFILLVSSLSNADENPITEFWYIKGGGDTSLVMHMAGYTHIQTRDILDHARNLDSLCSLVKWRVCIEYFHFGDCTDKAEAMRKKVVEIGLKRATIVCRKENGEMAISRVDSQFIYFDASYVREEYKSVNQDRNFVASYLRTQDENQKKNAAFERRLLRKQRHNNVAGPGK